MYLAITDTVSSTTLSGDSPVLGCTYFPKAPTKNKGEFQDVTETVEVNLRGTATAIRNTVNAIESYLELATARQATGAGAKIYAYYRIITGDSITWRSEIIEGRVEWSTEPGLRRLGDGTTPTARVAVIWTRRYFWETATEVEASISASGQAAATGGRTVTNDPANGNWVQAAAAQITGVLETPARLWLANNTGGSVTYTKLFLAVNANSDPANLTHYLQAEARASGGTLSADATCSGSGSNRLDFSAGTSPTFTWTLPAATLQKTKGRKVRLLARFAGSVGDLFVTPTIRDSTAAAILWTGDELTISTSATATIQDMGIIPLPAGGYAASYDAHALGLAFRGTSVVELDVLQLTTLDSYRYLDMKQTTVLNAAAIVHDGIEGQTYVSASSAFTAIGTAYGGPLMLQPNLLQRIYILYQAISGGNYVVPITGTFSVRLYYRPRRLVV